jgi:uncharacterized protein (TIGR00297 family)
LFAFFIPSVLLSRIGRPKKKALVDVGKTGPRDAWQVLANGGVATVCALAAWNAAPLALAAFGGAYAAATADTWGTEIGTLVRQAPRSILTLRPLPTGLSGGITLAGTLAECIGSLWLGAVATLVFAPLLPGEAWAFALAVALGGFGGALIDSLLGATVQVLWRCTACGRSCETNPHVCGATPVRIRGVGWVGNDFVNLTATLAGAGIAGVLYAALIRPA